MSFATSAYSVTASYFHWFAAFPMIGCVVTVLKAQQAPKEDKAGLMNLHKSMGLLTGMIVAPRVAYRIFNRAAVSFSRKGHFKRRQSWFRKNCLLCLFFFVIVSESRICLLLTQYSIESLPGSSKAEHFLANLSHAGL
jgi:cytochrome b561